MGVRKFSAGGSGVSRVRAGVVRGRGRMHVAMRRTIGLAVAIALVTTGFTAIDLASFTESAQAAGPITGTPVPADAFPTPVTTNTRLMSTAGDPQTFYAYTAEGEELQALFHKIGATNVGIDIVVTSPSGTEYVQTVPASGINQWGFAAGDLPSEEGIWQIQLVPLGTLSSNSTQMYSYSAVFDSDGDEKPGRVWAERLNLFQTGGRDLTLYFMSSLGYIYEADYLAYYGVNSSISADAVGNVLQNSDGSLNCSTSAYRSFTLTANTLTAAREGNGTYAMADGRCGGAYRIFFSPPFGEDAAGAVPASTPNPGESASDWVRPEIEPPFVELVDYVGTSDTTAAGNLTALVDNFFGSVEIEVLDGDGNILRVYEVNVPESAGLREVELPFDGLDDDGNPIHRDAVSTFRVRGLNAGEIHFVLNDVEQLANGMSVEVLNGPTAGTPEATRIYWADEDGFDGNAARCPVPAASVDTSETGVLSAPASNGDGVRCWASPNWGDLKAVDTWARQGVASSATLTLHDPAAEYTLVKDVAPAGREVLSGETVAYTVTLENVSDVDIWDNVVFDDLSGVLDDADFNDDVVMTPSWGGPPPSTGTSALDATEGLLSFRVNVPAGETLTITYSVTVRADADRGDDVLDNVVAADPAMPQPEPCPLGDPACRETSTPVKDLALEKAPLGQAVQNADGSWTVEYLVNARNLGANAQDITLADELLFGTGISVQSATAAAAAVGTPPAAGSWNGDTQTTVFSGSIPAGATFAYRVTVNATVAAGVIGSPDGLCPADPAERGGFNNAASLASSDAPAVSLTDDACMEPSRPAMQKALTQLDQNPDGTWNLEFRITVTNESANTLTYDLADALHFGPDSDVLDAAVSGSPAGVTLAAPPWNGETLLAIVDDASLPAASGAGPTRHEYILTVVAELEDAADVTAAEWQCPNGVSDANQAFNNLATLTSGAELVEDNACAEPTSPSLVKAVEDAPVQQPDGTWTLTYRLTVTNSGEDPPSGLSYSLEDTFEFPADVGVNSVTVDGPDGIAINPGFNGGSDEIGGVAVTPDAGLLDAGSATIPPGTVDGPTTHDYLVTVNVTIPAGMTTADRSCDAGSAIDDGGLSNTARLTGSGVDTDAQDCTDAPQMPITDVDKTVVSATQNDDGTWTIVYALDVTSGSDTLVAIYDLDDTLQYGSGIAVGSATVSDSPAGVVLADPAWNGQGDVRIATGATLSGGDTHHYEVTVTATPAPGVYGSSEGLCEADGGSAGGGFVNGAQTTSGNISRDDEDCVTIPAPELQLSKRVVGAPADVEIGEVVGYIITASNVGEANYTAANPADIVDDLTDVLDNAAYRNDATASLPGALDFEAPELSWTGVLRTGESVEISYTVSVTTLADLELRNVVGSPTACPECRAIALTTLAAPPLATTGLGWTAFTIPALIALLLLMTGTVLMGTGLRGRGSRRLSRA